ncbi:hypothetical protein [uncultured Nocardioides sp.]|uniref:hypothetical protein n=1 Tax=uncultured Nocardioides sp. TaxID=198441 RepID=UPI00261B5E81|nr:hypothetical protein [uncultured Nocardioides sp.]
MRNEPQPPVEGIVREPVRERVEPVSLGSRRVLSFRLEVGDANEPNRSFLIAVEMYAVGFTGFVANGERVQVDGKWKDGTLRAETIKNKTTGAEIRKKRAVLQWIAVGLTILFFIAFLGVVAVLLLASEPPF